MNSGLARMTKLFFVLFIVLLPAAHAQQTSQVGIAVYINDVNVIDPKKENIALDLTLNLQWQTEQASSKKQFYYGDGVNKVLDSMWWPYYQIKHSRGPVKIIRQALVIDKSGRANYEANVSVTIDTKMNMRRFPFDSHILQIIVKPFGEQPHPVTYSILHEKAGINHKAHLEEWRLNDERHWIKDENGQAVYVSSFDYQRKSGFYIHKVMVPLLLILLISYCVLLMPDEPTIRRLALVMATMLTVVAFQWAMSPYVPNLSYITFFEALLLFSYTLIASEAVIIILGEAFGGRHKTVVMYWAQRLYLPILLIGVGVLYLIWL